MTAADKIALWLAGKGIEYAFGVTGSGVIAIFDAIARRGATKIRCFHHEQAALQAAVFYHKYSGKHAVGLVTTGAGSSNALTGIVCAWMDSVPLLVIAGNEPKRFLEENVRACGAQGYQASLSVIHVTKRSAQIHNPALATDILENAFTEANAPRKGPVWVECPIDAQMANV